MEENNPDVPGRHFHSRNQSFQSLAVTFSRQLDGDLEDRQSRDATRYRAVRANRRRPHNLRIQSVNHSVA